jgi:Haem-NO-binding
MYGIVNRAIQDLVSETFGEEKWEIIKEKSGIDVDFFISTEPYDDDITYQLAGAISEEMTIPVHDVLFAFGEWWVLKTARQKYGGMMESGGASLKEFLVNLPVFHNRFLIMYPKLSPPEFTISHSEESSIWVHYRSKRIGLQDFVRGILSGLGEMYATPVHIELLQSRDDGSDHEIFKVSWQGL